MFNLLAAVGRFIRATFSFVSYTVNTFFWATPIFVLSVFKLIPLKVTRKYISIALDFCASGWVSVNTGIQALFSNYKIHLSGDTNLSKKDWYLVLANHQSWTDILILQRVFNGQIPFLKFFLKRELIYVPVLGLAWWALDFPFMRRYKKEFLAKHPHLKGKDLETTKKACEIFKYKPVSVMNFIEGTRFTKAKHKRQESPYQGLLKPKSGGIGFVLTVMGEQLHKVVDVTIYYPNKIPTFYNFISGRLKNVYLHVNLHEITSDLLGDYANDMEYKKRLHQWVNTMWLEKEQTLLRLQKQAEVAK